MTTGTGTLSTIQWIRSELSVGVLSLVTFNQPGPLYGSLLAALKPASGYWVSKADRYLPKGFKLI